MTIDDNILQEKINVKYLGVYLDTNLTWNPHIEYLCTKLSAASYLLIKLRHYVDLKTLIAVYNSIVYSYIQSSSSFEGHPLQARHKQNWGRGFILLLPQTAAMPGSDAGSDVIKPASSFVIQNCQTACSMWCLMYGAHY